MSSRPLKESERNQEATVYVGNIDPAVDETLLYQLMIQTGPVANVSMPKDKVTDEHQGFGFVEYQHVRDAQYTVDILHGTKLCGKQLRINKSSTIGQGDELDIGAIIFVGNLDPLVSEKDLEATFSTFGRLVRKPTIAVDEHGKPKGHAFVSFDSFEASDNAIKAMDNQYLMNQRCRVTYAYKKDSKEKHGDEAERLLAAQARKNRVTMS